MEWQIPGERDFQLGPDHGSSSGRSGEECPVGKAKAWGILVNEDGCAESQRECRVGGAAQPEACTVEEGPEGRGKWPVQYGSIPFLRSYLFEKHSDGAREWKTKDKQERFSSVCL